MKRLKTLVLTASDVRRLLSLDECIAAVEHAFHLHGEGRAAAPGVLGIHVDGGGFHIKAGVLGLRRQYFAAKVNGNFPANSNRYELPTIQGVIVLADAENGFPLAVMDSVEITALRTAAATAVAAKYLARRNARVVALAGCGYQGGFQLRALARVLPLEKAFVHDLDAEKAANFAGRISSELKLSVEAVTGFSDAVRRSEVCVTCTTARRYFLEGKDVTPGTFIAAVGADNPQKQEIEPALMATSKIVTDVTEQCIGIGDLHHAIASGMLSVAKVHAELGEIVAGKKPGRVSSQETVVFDSTGMALQDVAAAAVAYENAMQTGLGMRIEMAA